MKTKFTSRNFGSPKMNLVFAGKSFIPLHLASCWSGLFNNVSRNCLTSLVKSQGYCTSSLMLKDKSFKDSPAGPRKSKFADSKQTKTSIVRSDEEKAKLKQEREQREQKKAEVRERQLAIQAKRKEDEKKKQAKAVVKGKVTSKRIAGNDNDD